jgi:LmbE family N-acetylglucosaminyl deacetylase
MSNDLQLMTFDAGRVMAVVAHPDDLEYGAAAAIAKWTDAGSEVVYVLVTSGEAGIDGIAPAECAPLREEEERVGAAHVGVTQVEFLGFPDGVVEYGVPLRRAIAAKIREHRPDTVITGNHREHWGQHGGLNSPDHRAVGLAALEAVGDAANRWIFPDIPFEKHSAQRALVCGSPDARHAIELDASHVDRAIASLREHKAYLEGLGDHPMADPEFVRMFVETAGSRAGVQYALSVESFFG